jgi:hypothetical protein
MTLGTAYGVTHYLLLTGARVFRNDGVVSGYTW